MAKQFEVTVNFQDGFHGQMRTARSELRVGQEDLEASPYELLLGALASCYYSTFLDIMKKKKVNYERAVIQVRGEKRDEIPTTLKKAKLEITIIHAETEKGFAQAADLAAKYCSVYQTLRQVAEIEHELFFA